MSTVAISDSQPTARPRALLVVLMATLAIGVAGCGSNAAGDADAFPDGVYQADIVDAPYAPGTTSDSTMTFADGTWRLHDDSGAPDCLGTYVVADGRLQITTSSEKSYDCGNPVGHVFYSSRWTLDDGELRFTDIDSDDGATFAFGHQPWTKSH
jgi:hypothetical protein